MLTVDPPEGWRTETEKHIECFLDSLPPEERSAFDFSLISLDAWERWISGRGMVYSSVVEVSEDEKKAPGRSLYLCETVRRNFGGGWKLLVAGETIRNFEGQWVTRERLPIRFQGAEPCIVFGDNRPTLTPRHWIVRSSERNDPGLLRWTLTHFDARSCSEHCHTGLWRRVDPQYPERGAPLRFEFDDSGHPIGAVLEIEGTPVRLCRARSTLGRSKQADVVLDRSLVAEVDLISRIAAVVQICPHGALLLDDMSGTFVRVDGFQAPAQLFQGSEIQLGSAKLRLRREPE